MDFFLKISSGFCFQELKSLAHVQLDGRSILLPQLIFSSNLLIKINLSVLRF